MRISVNEEPNKNEAYIAEIDNPISKKLADFILIAYDITEAGFIVRKYILEEEKLKEGFMIEEDKGLWKIDLAKNLIESKEENFKSYIWESALIKYSRCFSNNKAKRIKLEKNKIFTQDQQKIAHDFFIDLRNKHVTHPVGILEIGKIGLRLSPKINKEKNFLGITTMRVTRVLETPRTLCTFINLCNEIIGFLEKNINIERKNLIDWIKKQNIEELYNLPYLSTKIPKTNMKKERT